MAKLSVRALQENDIPLLDTYWSSLSADDLSRMFIDRAKLNTGPEFRARIAKMLTMPLAERPADPLIWEVDGRAVGFTNLNNIDRGHQGDIHLHLIDASLRGRGLGRRLFLMSVEKYFERHRLTKIVCEPAATNAGPNGLLRALGIPVTRNYRTTPSVLCIEHDVNRYEIDRTLCGDTVARLAHAQ